MTQMSDTATIEKTSVPGWEGQTFLVGEKVYLRSFVPGDEKNAQSWRTSIFPKSPELMEKWIKEDLPKAGKKKEAHLAIVRKQDDVVVGNIFSYHGTVANDIRAHVDPLYGETGQHYLAEAVILVAQWMVDETFVPTVMLEIGANMDIAIAELSGQGFVETARWREMFEVSGKRFDKVCLSYFSQAWMDRIGNPMDAELPTTGTGEVRPVPAKVTLDGDPPKQAMMIGKRVYLRPQDKEDAKQFVAGHRKETEDIVDIGRRVLTLAEWEKIVSSEANDDFPGTLWFEVCLREDDTPIGSVGLMDIDYVNRTAESGSHFHSAEYRGKGYGSEAKHLLFEWAFDVLGLHMIMSFVLFTNTRSAAALRKQGYTESGRICWVYPYAGGFGNFVTFDLLADEWRNLPRASE